MTNSLFCNRGLNKKLNTYQLTVVIILLKIGRS